MPDRDDLGLAQMVQEAGAEYAQSLDAVQNSLRELYGQAALDDAAFVIAVLAKRGWQLTRTDATDEAG